MILFIYKNQKYYTYCLTKINLLIMVQLDSFTIFSLISSILQDYPLLFSDIPSNVYLSVKNYDFLGIQKNALFVQLVRFNPTRHLFYYEFQLLCLNASGFPFHLTFVFT